MPQFAGRPFTAASFNQYLSEGKLMASRCTACGALHLPPRAICPRCYGEAMEWVETSGRGRLAAFTAIHIGLSALTAEGHDREHPYCCGLVDLDEGVRISARLVGLDPKHPASIHIGTPLAVEFVAHGKAQASNMVLAFRPLGG